MGSDEPGARSPQPIAAVAGGSAEEHRLAFNAWPTLRTQGIEVVYIAADFTSAEIRMRLDRDTANYMGTMFGGSLFSMVDPFLVVLAMNQLGDTHVVWDKAAEIEFVRPGTGTVSATVDMPAAVVEQMRRDSAGGAKVLRWFELDLRDDDGAVVAAVRRQLYVRERWDGRA